MFSSRSFIVSSLMFRSLIHFEFIVLYGIQVGFRKGRGTRDQIANIHWITEKAREFQKKHLFLLYWLRKSLLLCGSQQTVENSSRYGNTRPSYLPSEKSVCRSRSNSWNQICNNRRSKLGKEYVMAIYCHPAYLNSMQSTSCLLPGWRKHKLESRLPGEISITSDMQITPPWSPLSSLPPP